MEVEPRGLQGALWASEPGVAYTAMETRDSALQQVEGYGNSHLASKQKLCSISLLLKWRCNALMHGAGIRDNGAQGY